MKKGIYLVTLVLIFCLLFSSCQNKSNFNKFDDYKESLNAIAEKAIEYYNNNNDEDKLLLALNKYETWADSSLENHIDNISDISVNNLYLKNGYLWVSSDYVIFWFDDLKTYGILYSQSASTQIKNIKEWYNDMEYNKLAENWYEIGQLNVR